MERATVIQMWLDPSVNTANRIIMALNLDAVVIHVIVPSPQTALNVMTKAVNVDANQVLLDVSAIDAYQAIGITHQKDVYVSYMWFAFVVQG